MTTLARRLGRVATIVSAKSEPIVPTYWTETGIERWRGWAVRLLESMPRERAELVYAV